MSETTRHRGIVGATVAGIVDRVRGPADEIDVDAVDRLEGLTVLVTGASSGLGRAVATQVAALGARTLVAQRSRHAESVAAIADGSGNADVAAYPLDLADPASIAALAQRLADERVALDRVVLNAGIVPMSARRTDVGLDVMFHVNFLGNLMLVDALIDAGVLQPGEAGAPDVPRVVVVGSESHRSAPPIDLDRFGEAEEYPTSKVVDHYGRSKLHLHTYATELARRYDTPEGPTLGVHHLCPGAVNSDIAREAPGWMKPLLRGVFSIFFQSPEKAARPVVWLAATPELRGETGCYLHMRKPSAPADTATDPQVGAAVWDKGHELAERIRS